MKKIDTADKSKDELAAMLKELQGRLSRYHFDKAEKKVKNTAELGMIKRDIARILTRINSV